MGVGVNRIGKPLFTNLDGVRAETPPDPLKQFESILQRSEEWPRLANTYTDWRDAIGINSLNYADENCIKIVSGFGDASLWGRNAGWVRVVRHRGVDIPGDDILVRAAADGIVIMTGALDAGPNAPYQRIAILHGPLGEGRFKGLYVITNYGHLKAGSLRVKEKQRIRRGAPLGLTAKPAIPAVFRIWDLRPISCQTSATKSLIRGSGVLIAPPVPGSPSIPIFYGTQIATQRLMLRLAKVGESAYVPSNWAEPMGFRSCSLARWRVQRRPNPRQQLPRPKPIQNSPNPAVEPDSTILGPHLGYLLRGILAHERYAARAAGWCCRSC